MKSDVEKAAKEIARHMNTANNRRDWTYYVPHAQAALSVFEKNISDPTGAKGLVEQLRAYGREAAGGGDAITWQAADRIEELEASTKSEVPADVVERLIEMRDFCDGATGEVRPHPANVSRLCSAAIEAIASTKGEVSADVVDIMADLESALVLTREHSPTATVSSFVDSSIQFKRLADFLHSLQHGEALNRSDAPTTARTCTSDDCVYDYIGPHDAGPNCPAPAGVERCSTCGETNRAFFCSDGFHAPLAAEKREEAAFRQGFSTGSNLAGFHGPKGAEWADAEEQEWEAYRAALNHSDAPAPADDVEEEYRGRARAIVRKHRNTIRTQPPVNELPREERLRRANLAADALRASGRAQRIGCGTEAPAGEVGELVARLRKAETFCGPLSDVSHLFGEAATALAEAEKREKALLETLHITDIRQLEDDVRYYNGNEASGHLETLRRKAAAWDRVVAILGETNASK